MHQRFGQSTSNILNRLIKPKKKKSEEGKEEKKELVFERREQQGEMNESSEVVENMMILADETPNEKRYAWMHYEEEKE